MSSLTTSLPQGDGEEILSTSAGILVVTSNQDLRRSLMARLEIGRWNLLEASSGAEALQIMETVPVTLVLLDPGLPDLKVEDFRGIIGSEYPDVTIVPINPHTGQPIVASPSPDSLCFEMIRKIERGAPYSGSSRTTTEEFEDARPSGKACLDSLAERQPCSVCSRWRAKLRSATLRS